MRAAFAGIPILLAACAAPEPSPPSKGAEAAPAAAPGVFVVPEEDSQGEELVPVPAGIRMTLESDFPEWFVGEAATLRLMLHNDGDAWFRLSEKPLFASAGCRVQAIHEDGREAPEPPRSRSFVAPNLILKPLPDLGPGQSCAAEEFSLSDHRAIDRPGVWTIRAWNTYGWTATPGKPLPFATLRLRFVQPEDPAALREFERLYEDPARALERVEFLPYLERKAMGWSSFGRDPNPFQVIERIAERDPERGIPVLERLARAGQGANLLHDVAHPGATRALVGLLAADEETAVEAAWALMPRLPAPRGPAEWHSAWEWESKAALRGTWVPDLAPAVRTWARRSLMAPPMEGSHAVAGRILQCIGEREDAPALLPALEALLAGLRADLGPGDSRWDGVLSDSGQLLDCWGALSGPETMSLPEGVRRKIGELLESPHPGIRGRVCLLAARSADPDMTRLLLVRVAGEDDSDALQCAFYAAIRSGSRKESARAIARRLDAREPLRWVALSLLVQEHVVGDGFRDLRFQSDASPDLWGPLRDRWLAFLESLPADAGPEFRLLPSDPERAAALPGGLLVLDMGEGTMFPPSPK